MEIHLIWAQENDGGIGKKWSTSMAYPRRFKKF